MARGRRGRRKKITYDSNETRMVIGFLLLLVSIMVFLSNFAEGVAFDFIKDLFGSAVIFFSLFFLSLSLKLLGVLPDHITGKTVFGFFLVAISISIFQTGEIGLPANAKNIAYDGGYGGVVGYELSELIGDYLFRDLIKPLGIFMIFFSIPFILSMSISEYFNTIKKIVVVLKEKLDKIQAMIPQKQYEISEENLSTEGDSLTMVGDFRKKHASSFVGKSPEFAGVEKDLQKAQLEHEEKQKMAGETGKHEQSNEKDTSSNANEMLIQEELMFPDWKLPPLELLHDNKNPGPSSVGVEKNTKIIEQTLSSFGVNAKVVDVLVGPTVTQYALDIALGTKVSKIANLRNDLALALATSADAVRVEAPIPGTSFVGIEVPNEKRQMITFRELVETPKMDEGHLMVTIGRDIAGEIILADIQKMPHLLIAGATGSGKSVVTNSFVMSLLMKKSPDEVKLIMVDPKQVEFSDYNGIPHLLTPVITDMDKVNNALKWCIVEMERRYTEFRENQVRNIEDYNKKRGFIALPYIVIVIDEMADMMMSRNGADLEASIVKLAQKARATGIHLILATQRPSVDVITGLIKANIPGRIGMSVTTQIDSRVILDQIGAESLLGRGDLLFKNPGENRLTRIQGPYVAQDEVIRVVSFIKDQTPDDLEFGIEVTNFQSESDLQGGDLDSSKFSDDELFAQAARVVVNSGKGSSSLIQRKLSVGYNRAARLLDELYEHGVVGPQKGSKPRDVLISDVESFLQGQSEGIVEGDVQ